MFLIPGDSPVGYRLPLDSLPWVAPGEDPDYYEADPFAEPAPLPPRQQYLPGRPPALPPRDAVSSQAPPKRGESAARVLLPAMRAQPRHGRLHVFMPPLGSTADYLDLVAA